MNPTALRYTSATFFALAYFVELLLKRSSDVITSENCGDPRFGYQFVPLTYLLDLRFNHIRVLLSELDPELSMTVAKEGIY